MAPEQKKRGRPSPNPKTRFLGVRVNDEQMEFLRREAKRHGISMGDFVRGIIEEERHRVRQGSTWSAFAAKAMGLRLSPERRRNTRRRG